MSNFEVLAEGLQFPEGPIAMPDGSVILVEIKRGTLSRVHKGGHVNNPKVTITQGTIVRIETLLLQDAMPLEADGNVRGVTPVQFQVLPGALRFVSRA